MGAMYGRRIRKHEITIDDVPQRWKQATLDWLAANPE